MVVFVDRHTRAAISMEAFERGLDLAVREEANAHGACPIDYVIGPGGLVICVVEAPNAAAVEQLHADLGLPHPEVMSVPGGLGGRPLSPDDRELILRLVGWVTQ